MAKAKEKAKVAKKENKNTLSHIRARLNYLHQAAAYLQGKSTEQKSHNVTQAAHEAPNDKLAYVQACSNDIRQKPEPQQRAPPMDRNNAKEPLGNLSRVCVSHLRDVAMKTQIRLPVTLKRSLCKRCAIILTPGVTCSHETRNESRGGKKPWADVLIVRCLACGTEKRFPQTDKRAKKLVQRRQEKEAALSQNDPRVDSSSAALKGEGVNDQHASTVNPSPGA